jgi:hypothetical protein
MMGSRQVSTMSRSQAWELHPQELMKTKLMDVEPGTVVCLVMAAVATYNVEEGGITYRQAV